MSYVQWLRTKVGHEKVFLNCVAAVIIDKMGRILLQKRSDRCLWGFPGGIVELGESVTEALYREVKEETGFHVRAVRPIGIYSKYFDSYPNGDQAQTVTMFFLCKILKSTGDPVDSETFDLDYFDPTTVPELVNQQHRDMLSDFLQDSSESFIR